MNDSDALYGYAYTHRLGKSGCTDKVHLSSQYMLRFPLNPTRITRADGDCRVGHSLRLLLLHGKLDRGHAQRESLVGLVPFTATVQLVELLHAVGLSMIFNLIRCCTVLAAGTSYRS